MRTMTDRSTTLRDLAELVGGRIEGDVSTDICGAAILRDVKAGEITLVDHADRLKRLQASVAAAVVLSEKVAAIGNLPVAAIVVDDVHAAFAKIVCHFRPPRTDAAIGISPQAIVSPTAAMGQKRQHPSGRDGRRRLSDRRRHDDPARRTSAGWLRDRPRSRRSAPASCFTKTPSSATARSFTAAR